MTAARSFPYLDCRCQQLTGLAATKTRLLLAVLLLWVGLAVLEAIASRSSHSLALLADAGHLSMDAGAITIALLAAWLAKQRVRQPQQSQRVEALAASLNGLGLAVMAGAIAWEAWQHLQARPQELLSVPMLLTALVGLAVNGFNATLLAAASRDDLNLRGAFLHVLADAASAGGTVLAALAVHFWRWFWVDAVLGLAIALVMATSTVPLLRQSWRAWQQTASVPNLQAVGFYELGQTDLQQVLQRERATR
ncbi:MAG: cation transporter [Spirulinaceae cyanobacterium SM2_1_0]|nr:cation transporter [Spirulinaceae cyanobacterium SM2_1_0]